MSPHRPLSEIDEAELVARAQRRDEQAFAELMHRNTSTSLRLALSVLKDRQEAEDQVQTSFLKAWMGLGSFQSESRFSTWFRRIVINQSLMRLRVVKRTKLQSLTENSESERPIDPASVAPTPEAQLSRQQIHDRLRKEVLLLPPLFREVLTLRDLNELSTEEVSAQLGISEAATKSRLARARALLRERMERHVGGSSPSLI
ncbi:MAG: sigma-70 family RNA polymerase sigma factor [Acidobacteriota bacterium]